jgi:hypothetical protein
MVLLMSRIFEKCSRDRPEMPLASDLLPSPSATGLAGFFRTLSPHVPIVI